MGRRKAEELLVEDRIDAHQGGFLSNVCLACMPVFEEHKVVNMIGACLDTTITTRKCSRFTFRPFGYAPAQAVAFAPSLVKLGKKWHIAYADYAWGQSTRTAYVEQIKKNGGMVVGGTGIPLGTADMTPFLSKIRGNFDGLFAIFFGRDGVAIGNQAFDLGLTKKYKWAGDGGSPSRSTCRLLAIRSRVLSASIAICRYSMVHSTHRAQEFLEDASARLKQIDPSGPLPDSYVHSNFEAMNALQARDGRSQVSVGREDTMKLIEALEGRTTPGRGRLPSGG